MQNHQQRRKMVKIESGIEFTGSVDRKAGRPMAFPWADMQVGQSFALPDGAKRANVVAAARRAEKKLPGLPMFRVVLDRDGKLRAWRVA